jgi:hypothetical protein
MSKTVNLSTAPLAGRKGAVLRAGSGAKLRRNTAQAGPVVFRYSVKPKAPYLGMFCSLGIKVDGVLVRTLFSAEWVLAGDYFGYWDGKCDRGFAVPRRGKPTTAVVLTNNLEHVWQGGWGNNSDHLTGEFKHGGGDPNFTATIYLENGEYVVPYEHGFKEGRVPHAGFKVNTMRTLTHVANTAGGSGLSVDHVRSNADLLIYFGADPYNSDLSFAFAVSKSTKYKIEFDWGLFQGVNTGVPYDSAIDIVKKPGALPSGLIVNDRWAYLCRTDGTVHVVSLAYTNNKVSGQVALSLLINQPGNGKIDGNYCFIAHGGNQLSRYAMSQADGSLSDPFAIPITAPALSMDIDGDELFVLTGGDRHTVQVFDKNTGAFLRENHPVGGAKATTVVTPTTLLNYFGGKERGELVIIPESGGDYIVLSPGVWRTVRYNKFGQFQQMLMQVPRNYENTMCQNAPHLNFAGHQQFSIDHEASDYRTAATLTHCRELFQLPGYQVNPKFHTMAPSGRIFCQFGNFNYQGNGTYQTIAEVTEAGYRFIQNVNVEATLYPDLSLRWQEVALGGYLRSMRQECLDKTAENLTWGPADEWDGVALEPHDNAPASVLRGEVTGSGISVSWSGALQFKEESGNHLLFYKDGRRLAACYPALPQRPIIPFHKHGKFRTCGIARGIRADGTEYLVSGGSSDRAQVFGPNREIVRIHFHDEFDLYLIQSNQNIFYHESGLMLGTFGNTNAELNGDTSAANACGNAINSYTHWIPGINKWRTVYSGETTHGIHFFDSSNFESIQLVEITI